MARRCKPYPFLSTTFTCSGIAAPLRTKLHSRARAWLCWRFCQTCILRLNLCQFMQGGGGARRYTQTLRVIPSLLKTGILECNSILQEGFNVYRGRYWWGKCEWGSCAFQTVGGQTPCLTLAAWLRMQPKTCVSMGAHAVASSTQSRNANSKVRKISTC